MAPTTLYVVTSFVWDDDEAVEGVREPEVYTNKSRANEAARQLLYRYADQLSSPHGSRDEYNYYHNLDDEGLYRGSMDGGGGGHIAANICVYKVGLNKPSKRQHAKKTMEHQCNWPESGDKEEDDDEDIKEEEEDGDDEEAKKEEDDDDNVNTKPAKSKRPLPASRSIPKMSNTRKKIPPGIPNCLDGVKLLFTGTFETMDRVTSLATARKYGAEIVTKLEDTDYIVTGVRIGPKKAQVINELELETINEEEFFQILENGVSKEKRERMANKRKADEEEGPGEEEEEEEKPRRASAPAWRKGKRTKR